MANYDIDKTLESLLVEKKKTKRKTMSLLGDEDGKIVSIIDDVINNKEGKDK